MPTIQYVVDLQAKPPALRPCPFCNRSQVGLMIVRTEEKPGCPMSYFHIECTNCGMKSPIHGGNVHNWREVEEAQISLVKQWNDLHRPCDDPPPQEDPRLKMSARLGMIQSYAKMIEQVVEELQERN